MPFIHCYWRYGWVICFISTCSFWDRLIRLSCRFWQANHLFFLTIVSFHWLFSGPFPQLICRSLPHPLPLLGQTSWTCTSRSASWTAPLRGWRSISARAVPPPASSTHRQFRPNAKTPPPRRPPKDQVSHTENAVHCWFLSFYLSFCPALSLALSLTLSLFLRVPTVPGKHGKHGIYFFIFQVWKSHGNWAKVNTYMEIETVVLENFIGWCVK